MKYYSGSDGPSYSIVACVPVSDFNHYGRSPWSSNSIWGSRYCGDSFFFNVSATARVVCAFGPVRSTSIIGVQPYADPSVVNPVDLRYEKPSNFPWNSAQDWLWNGGSLLQSLNIIKQKKDDRSFIEHQVQHLTAQGQVRDFQDINFRYNRVPVAGAPDCFSLTPKSPAHRPYRGLLYAGSFEGFPRYSIQQQPVGGSLDTNHPSMEIESYLNTRHLGLGADGLFYKVPTADCWYYVTSISNESFRSENAFHIRYSYVWRIKYRISGRYWIQSDMRVAHTYDILFSPSYGSNDPFSLNQVSRQLFALSGSTSVDLIYHTDWDTLSSNTGFSSFQPTWSDDYHLTLRQDGSPLATQTLLLGTVETPAQSADLSNLRLFFREGTSSDFRLQLRFKRNCLQRLQDVRPAAFYSSSDALHNIIDIIEANHLENLSQLKLILETLPDLPGLAKLVTKLLKGDPRAIKDLIDYVSDAILKYRWAQRPLVKDIDELTKLTDFQDNLDDLLKSSWYTGYGKFTYTFRDDENFMSDGTLKLTVRSKVRFYIDISTLMAQYLTLNGMGLLPTLSRIWDLVPFSFVVDWFVNMDNRLASVDDQILWLAMYVSYCVHSYTIDYYPSDDVMSSYGIQNVPGAEPFHLKFYRREYSVIIPRLRGSRYDFLAPSTSPDPVTVGAFVWQVIS